MLLFARERLIKLVVVLISLEFSGTASSECPGNLVCLNGGSCMDNGTHTTIAVVYPSTVLPPTGTTTQGGITTANFTTYSSTMSSMYSNNTMELNSTTNINAISTITATIPTTLPGTTTTPGTITTTLANLLTNATNSQYVATWCQCIAPYVGSTCQFGVTTISPSYGPYAGGTRVTIQGEGLSTIQRISLVVDNATALNCAITLRSDTEISLTSPPLSDVNSTDDVIMSIVYTLTDGSTVSYSEQNFTYKPNPVIDSIRPNFIPLIAGGGTQLTLIGSSLDSVANPFMTVTVVTVTETTDSVTNVTSYAETLVDYYTSLCQPFNNNSTSLVCSTPPIKSTYANSLTPASTATTMMMTTATTTPPIQLTNATKAVTNSATENATMPMMMANATTISVSVMTNATLNVTTMATSSTLPAENNMTMSNESMTVSGITSSTMVASVASVSAPISTTSAENNSGTLQTGPFTSQNGTMTPTPNVTSYGNETSTTISSNTQEGNVTSPAPLSDTNVTRPLMMADVVLLPAVVGNDIGSDQLNGSLSPSNNASTTLSVVTSTLMTTLAMTSPASPSPQFKFYVGFEFDGYTAYGNLSSVPSLANYSGSIPVLPQPIIPVPPGYTGSIDVPTGPSNPVQITIQGSGLILPEITLNYQVFVESVRALILSISNNAIVYEQPLYPPPICKSSQGAWCTDSDPNYVYSNEYGRVWLVVGNLAVKQVRLHYTTYYDQHLYIILPCVLGGCAIIAIIIIICCCVVGRRRKRKLNIEQRHQHERQEMVVMPGDEHAGAWAQVPAHKNRGYQA